LYTSCNGNLNAKSTGRVGGGMSSKASNKVLPLYHHMLSERLNILSPFQPEIGTKGTFSTL
jgi:hypothetical protein